MTFGPGTLVMMRHAVTASNEAGRYAGRIDDGISREDIQLGALAERIVPEVEEVWTSPRRRCAETLRLLGISGPWRVDERLDELDFGPWSGLDGAEVSRSFPAEWREWRTEPQQVRVPGMEPLPHLSERTADWLQDVDTAAISLAVTHETVIRSAIVSAEPATMTYRSVSVSNLGCAVFVFGGHRWHFETLYDAI